MWRLTDEQRELRDSIRTFAQEVVRPKMLDVDASSPYPMEVHEAMAAEGLLKLAIPSAYGGRDSTNVAYCSFIEELARVSCTASLMAAYVKLTTLPIILAGSDEQKQRFLPGLASGEHLGSYAITEPGVGSDPAALTTKAERHGDTWVLNGTKRFIGNAGLSHLYVVFARTGEEGAGGVSAFVVDGESDGLSVEELPTMGMPGWRLGAPTFTDVEVPHANLLGEEGDGFRIAMGAFDTSRPTVASQAVGLGQGAVDLALDYARRRETFGEPLIEHQGVQFKLAGLEAKVAAARSLTYQAATCVDEQDPGTTKLAAAAKLFASDTAMEAATEAVQVLGGNGYLKEFPAERMMRDAKVLQIYEGANEIQMLVIARQMVEEAEARGVIWSEAVEAEGRTEPAESEEVGARA